MLTRVLFTVTNLLAIARQQVRGRTARYCFTISVCLSVNLWYSIVSIHILNLFETYLRF